MAEQDFYFFSRLLFRASTGRQWIAAQFQRVIAKAMEAVYNGDITQLIINIPPRYGKTWLVVVLWVAWCLAKAPWARFLYTSYSDELIYTSSRFVRDVLSCEIYQLLWPNALRQDAQAKKAWTLEGTGGGLNAAPVGGQLTGFGAGVTGFEGFSGARLVDDPNKVQDAGSKIARERVKMFYTETFESRKEHKDVPTVIVQQRTDEDDLSGYLLTTGAHGRWHHLLIEGLVEDTEYPIAYQFGDPIDHGLGTGPLWPYKHSVEELEGMRDNAVTEHAYWSQYQQRPVVRGGGMIKREWINFYKRYDPLNSKCDDVVISNKRIYCDTAMKTGEKNDFSVFLVAAKGSDGNLYVLDMWHNKVEAPELVESFKCFCEPHAFVANKVNTGINSIFVEDKASGTGLIQTINRDSSFISRLGGVSIEGIPRNTDKVSRMHGVAPHVKAGKLFIPENAPWRERFLSEVTSFNKHETHAHDDITDTVMDAVTDQCIEENGGLDYGALRAY